MEYKINYIKNWDKEGTCYRQNIIVKLNFDEWRSINHKIFALKADKENKDYLYLTDFIYFSATNYCTLTTSKVFAEHFGIDKDKRYKADRNTTIKIIPQF